MRAFLLLLLLGNFSVAFGYVEEDSILLIEASGSILGPPEWQNEGQDSISELTFQFSGQQSPNLEASVLSNSHLVTLIDPANASGSVTIQVSLPSSCSIGDDGIADNYVRLIFNSTEYGDNSSISITEGLQNSLELEFDGDFQSAYGTVSCGNSGSLSYTY